MFENITHDRLGENLLKKIGRNVKVNKTCCICIVSNTTYKKCVFLCWPYDWCPEANGEMIAS